MARPPRTLPLFRIKEGCITAPDKPGLGVDPDPEIVKRYQV
jgi:L-alanine-DL-glutamate epimerase-like enolase superfamily enzyme